MVVSRQERDGDEAGAWLLVEKDIKQLFLLKLITGGLNAFLISNPGRLFL